MSSDSGWISFTNSSARWIPFSVNPEMERTFGLLKGVGRLDPLEHTESRVTITQAESSIQHYIVNRITEEKSRANRFRALGRGWIFIMLDLPGDRFRWWFESLDNVFLKHKFELSSLGMEENELQKYTYGYNCQSEVVFLLKLAIRGSCKSSILLMRLKDPGGEQWGKTGELPQWPSDDELNAQTVAHAKRTRQRRAYKQRLKQRHADARNDEEAQTATPDSVKQSNDQCEFEQLLATIKSEINPTIVLGDVRFDGYAADSRDLEARAPNGE